MIYNNFYDKRYIVITKDFYREIIQVVEIENKNAIWPQSD